MPNPTAAPAPDRAADPKPAKPAKPRAKRDPARAARIRSLIENGGMSPAEARACEGLVCL